MIGLGLRELIKDIESIGLTEWRMEQSIDRARLMWEERKGGWIHTEGGEMPKKFKEQFAELLWSLNLDFRDLRRLRFKDLPEEIQILYAQEALDQIKTKVN
jgi:hypothetical protein